MRFKTTAEDGERKGAAVTCDGKLFYRRAAATVDRRVRRTSRDVDEAERGRRLDSVSAVVQQETLDLLCICCTAFDLLHINKQK